MANKLTYRPPSGAASSSWAVRSSVRSDATRGSWDPTTPTSSPPAGWLDLLQRQGLSRRFTDHPRLVAATVDRVTFNAHIVETGTESYRLATSKTTTRRKPMA